MLDGAHSFQTSFFSGFGDGSFSERLPRFAASPWAARGAAILFGLAALFAAGLLMQAVLNEHRPLLYALPLVAIALLNAYVTSNWGVVEMIMSTTPNEIGIL